MKSKRAQWLKRAMRPFTFILFLSFLFSFLFLPYPIQAATTTTTTTVVTTTSVITPTTTTTTLPGQTTTTTTTSTTTTTLHCAEYGATIDPDNTVGILTPGVAKTIPVLVSGWGLLDVFLDDGGVGGQIVCPSTGCAGGVNLGNGGLQFKTVNFTYTAPLNAPDLIKLTVTFFPNSATCGFIGNGSSVNRTFVTNANVTTTTITTTTTTTSTTTTTLHCAEYGATIDPDNTVGILTPGVAKTIPVLVEGWGLLDIYLDDGGVGGQIVCPSTGCAGGVNLGYPLAFKTVNFTYTAPLNAPDLIKLTVTFLPNSATCGFIGNGSSVNKTFVTNANVTTTTITTTTLITTTTSTMVTTTTTIPGMNQPPSADSLTTVNIATAPSVAQSFTAVYSDPDGYQNITDASLLISGNTHIEWVHYSPTTNKFTMMGVGGDCSPGQAAMLSNAYLTLNCSASSASSSGAIWTVTYSLTPQTPLSGAPYLLMIYVVDQANASNSKMPGTWIVNRPPSADTLSPANSMTDPMMSQMFTAIYSDPDGWQNIAAANFYLSGNGGMHNEWLHYLVAPNLFTMMGTNDSCNPGQMKMLSNGYLTLDCSSSSISGSGSILTVIFQATPQMSSSGIQYNIFTAASDQAAAAYAIFAGTWQIQ